MQLNSISFSPNNDDEKKQDTKIKKKSKFPWAKWDIDTNNDDDDDDDNLNKHRQRRSSLGSVREFYRPKVKKATIKANVQPIKRHNETVVIKSDDLDKINRKKERKKKKKKHHFEGGNVDIYDPDSLKKHRKKEKNKYKFKVVPKHHVKRSSLPTYQSIRKNNPKLTHYVAKESKRDLAMLLDQPEKRAKSKHLKNLSQAGFELHVNKRYRLEDGRVGVCKYKGRTQFGKSSEDWIGLVIEVGLGEHDGSVKGKSYFRCRDGKGLFVRPYDIIQDMGSHTKMLSKQDIKLAKKHIKRYKKMKNRVATSSNVVDDSNPDHGETMLTEKYYNPKTLIDKNKGKQAKKKKRHFQI